MEKLSRRKALLGLAAAGAGAALVGAAEAQDREDPNLSAQKERLRNVLEHVEIADDRLKGAAVRWVALPIRAGPRSRLC